MLFYFFFKSLVVRQHGHCAPAVEDDLQTSTVAKETSTESSPPSSNSYLNEMKKCGTEVATAAEEALKAGGRIMVSTLGLLTLAWKGLSTGTAVTGENLARGYKTVNKLTGDIPVIGTITTGVDHLINGVTKTYSENSQFNNDRRTKLVDDLRAKLDEFKPGDNFKVKDATTAQATTGDGTQQIADTPTPPEG